MEKKEEYYGRGDSWSGQGKNELDVIMMKNS